MIKTWKSDKLIGDELYSHEKTIMIAKKESLLYDSGRTVRIVFVHGHHPMSDNDDVLWERICPSGADRGCALLSYTVEDWNDGFSPWKAKNPFDDKMFGGGGPDTLDWVKHGCIPYIKESYGNDVKVVMIGYSLSGLFALWSLYRSDCFAGAVCCSGSLWFEGWMEYAAGHEIAPESKVYLSLGGKEEKTDDPVIARIGSLTRETAENLGKVLGKKNVILKMNKGGHFADHAGRLAQGIEWIMDAVFKKV